MLRAIVWRAGGMGTAPTGAHRGPNDAAEGGAGATCVGRGSAHRA